MDQRPYTTRAQKALALDEKTGPAAQMLVHLGVTSAGIRKLLMEMRSGRPT